MDIVWEDPPREIEDELEDIIRELKKHRGTWARILSQSGDWESYVDHLYSTDVEYRIANRTGYTDIRGTYTELADLYVRVI